MNLHTKLLPLLSLFELVDISSVHHPTVDYIATASLFTSKDSIVVIVTGVLVVLPTILYFVLPQFKSKTKLKNFEQEISNESMETKKEDKNLITNDIHDDVAQTQLLMSENAVRKILSQLYKFEKKQLYIQRDLSLSHLAIYCETNTKYLSIVINTYKKKDFYNYINELRINYIIKKLKENPYYRRLKIAALAKEAGFSSQSKFAIHFRKVTGVSPSVFIRQLSET